MKALFHRYKVALYVWIRILKKEMKRAAPLSFIEKIYAWTRGFTSASYVLYQFKTNNSSDYLNDWAESFRGKFINQNTLFIDNKILFPQLVKPYLKMTDEPFLIMNGKLIPLAKPRSVHTIEDLIDQIQNGSGKIFKPVDGSSGDGIIKISYSNGTWSINQRTVTREECIKLVSSLNHYLVSEIITQATYSNNIYPNSVNTIRVLTMIDPDSRTAFIAVAAHRIGNNQSYPVDNCAAGGYTAPINIDTGVMGKAISTIVNNNTLVWFSHHPDSHAAIEGVQIPNWENLKTTITNIAQSLFFIPYIGWDIVVTDTGFTIIEANDEPDIKLHQVHAPLLTDPRVKAFYRHHHVL